MDRNYNLRRARYRISRLRRRLETPLFVAAVAILIIVFIGMVVFLADWARKLPEKRDTDLLSAVGTWAIGFIVPATGGLVAWRALCAKERDRRRDAWRRAIRVAARSPMPDGTEEKFDFKIWSIVVNAPEDVDLVQLVVGVADADIDPGAELDLDGNKDEARDSSAVSVGMESREVSYTDVHVGGRRYFHPHPFPVGLTSRKFTNNTEKYKAATMHLSPRKAILFTVDGYRFIRMFQNAYFMDEAPANIYRAGLRLEKQALEAQASKSDSRSTHT